MIDYPSASMALYRASKRKTRKSNCHFTARRLTISIEIRHERDTFGSVRATRRHQTCRLGFGYGLRIRTRNALYLGLKGFDVTAVDNNPHAVQNVEELARIEELNVRAFEYRPSTPPIFRKTSIIWWRPWCLCS